jgi:hypothetical protein
MPHPPLATSNSCQQKGKIKLGIPSLLNILRLMVLPESRKKPFLPIGLSKIAQLPRFTSRDCALNQEPTSRTSLNHWQEKPWEIKEFIVSGLFQAISASGQEKWHSAFYLADELLSMGLPIPWLGFLEDLTLWSQGAQQSRITFNISGNFKNISSNLRTYKDQVIGRLMSDPGCLALTRELAFQPTQQKSRGLAWLMAQWPEAGLWVGKPMVPGQLASLRSQATSALEARAMALAGAAPPELQICLGETIRRTSQGFSQSRYVYRKYYLEGLQSGQSSLRLAQFTALRQIQKARETLFAPLNWDFTHAPSAQPESDKGKMLEDEFPIGGYSSITNKGRFESLLPSQLAYWDEPIGQTDLFTLKFARDELWYYSRDENAIRRPHLEVVFILEPGVSTATSFDPTLGFQALTLLIATLLEMISVLEHHRDFQALNFRWIFQHPTGSNTTSLRTANKSLQNLLRVLLGTRLLQQQQTLEELTESEIQADLTLPRKNRDLRSIRCLSYPIQAPVETTNQAPESALLGLDGCQPRLFVGQEEIGPDSTHQKQYFSWLANALAWWCQSPTGSPFNHSVLRPFSR